MSRSKASRVRGQVSTRQLDALVERCRQNMRSGRGVLDGLSSQEAQAVQTRYSSFEDSYDSEGFLTDSAVHIKSPNTPRPFVHLMSCHHDGLFDQWGSFWDQHGGGFSCVDSVLAGRMTSHLDTNYVPTSPEPQDVRNFYLHEKGQSWPMFPVAGYQDDRYAKWSCRQGMDTYELGATRAAVTSSLRVFVHPDMPLEVWQVTLKNNRRTPRSLTWFARLRVNVDSFPFYYFVPRVVCEGVLEQGAMVFLNHDKGNKHPRAAFMMADHAFDGYDMMNEVFEGGPGRSPLPAAVQRGKCFNSLGLQPYAGLVAAVQFNARLKGSGSQTWTIVYGKCPTEAQERAAFLKRVRKEVIGRGDECLTDLTSRWERKVSANAIQTPDPQVDRFYNVWFKYQLRNQCRFGAALDKVGYRDILQYMLGVTDFEPSFVRRTLAHTLKNQFPDGRAVRQYEKFPNSGHDTRMYQDSAIWIPDTLSRYVKETGDRAFLDEEVPFLDAATLAISGTEKASVYEHARRAVHSVYGNTGYHGLCKIGYGDWNDAISGIGGEKGVSVWLSCACVWAANVMAELAQYAGRADDGREFAEMARVLTERINQHAWDGRWYVYAINGQGEPIGSSRSAEGKIHLNVNTWALFSGVAAAAGREDQVWKAIGQLDSPFGHLLLKPSYTRPSRPLVGRIADVMPGMFENGSVYTHGEAFCLFAMVSAGKPDRWIEQVYKTLPSNLVPDISTGPPHQLSNFSVGPDHVSWGANLFSNFTGSTGWFRRTIEKVVGILPEFDGLRIAPRPPSTWDHYRVKRTFRGCRLLVDLRRGREFEVKMNGRPVGEFIPIAQLPSGKTCRIEVTYR